MYNPGPKVKEVSKISKTENRKNLQQTRTIIRKTLKL